MSVHLDQIRLAAAIAHSIVDADVELVGQGRRWLFSSWRPDATMDLCGFRQLVVATMRGCRVGILPIDQVRFVGALEEIGGGVFQRVGDHRERRLGTFLSAPRIESLLAARRLGPGCALSAHVQADTDLGVAVVTIPTAHPAYDRRLDGVVGDIAAACLVAELLDSVERETAV